MKKIRILDCTLRDGGYVNNWKFGFENIKDTVKRLIQAGIDIIEVGYLSSKGDFSADESQYSSVDAIKRILPADRKNTLIAVMINCGDYDAELLPQYDGTGPDCIRVCFHKSQALQAVELCRKIKDKGYKVYFQPMVALSYSDAEYLGLIGMANKFRPDVFYIVDSHGSMKQKDVARFFYLIENNLDKEIAVGFHSHNNLQLSYSNAQYLAALHTDHKSAGGEKTPEADLSRLFEGRNVVIIAPGRTTSVESERQKVFDKVKATDAIVISVNHCPEWIKCDYVFVSNIRRYEKLSGVETDKLIITSNINAQAGYTVGYEPLLCSIEAVRDNVTLMLIALLIKSGASSVYLAGVDGYSFKERNFAYSDMETYEDEQVAKEQNNGISAAIAQLSQRIPVSFITKSLLEREENRS